jgi:succinate dehydrogenase / fumarate reductase cytochrome b subunit
MSNPNRPISPHLSIYRKQISSVLSIFHRLAGLALFVGTGLLVSWLWSAAYAPEFYPQLHEYLSSLLGQVALFGWMAAFYYHLANGIRHLFWDMGKGFELSAMAASGWAVVLFTVLMTMFTWGFIHSAAGV